MICDDFLTFWVIVEAALAANRAADQGGSEDFEASRSLAQQKIARTWKFECLIKLCASRASPERLRQLSLSARRCGYSHFPSATIYCYTAAPQNELEGVDIGYTAKISSKRDTCPL